ncbi:MAG: hypothetical protein VX944_12960 [Myxococcota bacterium]|nr:hypothetical protein [Myxococcota bacterium]MEC9390976.1 hypothetical protein [Myxococcota bacterium]
MRLDGVNADVVKADGATVAGEVTGEADNNALDASGTRCATRRVAVMPAAILGARTAAERATGLTKGSEAVIASSAAMSGDAESVERNPRRALRRDAMRP